MNDNQDFRPVRPVRDEADRDRGASGTVAPDPESGGSEPRMRLRDYLRVYRAVRKGGHGWWRAIHVWWRIGRGQRWQARDIGEMRAQLLLIADAMKDKP